MRGDMRAMEEQMMLPQSNPVRGGGATPSMGLSQFRGGGMLGEDGHGMRRMVGAGTGGMSRMVGCGTGGRKGKKSAEAMAMGHALGKHLHQLHGGGFFDDFKSGFNSVFAPVAGVAKSLLPMAGPEGMAASGVLGALGYGRHGKYDRRRTGCGTGAGKLVITHGGGRERDDVAMMSGRGMSGCGSDSDEEMEGGQSFANPSNMGMSGAYQGQGYEGGGFFDDFKSGFNSVFAPVAGVAKSLLPMAGPEGMAASGVLGALGYGRRRRAPAGANDGRRKRAEVVKKVMSERGISMIEASKYVKAHGLY
jgi:hypothetical protein